MLNIMARTALTAGIAAACLSLSTFSASAREISFRDGFENGNQQGWTSNGEVVLQIKQPTNSLAEPHTGNGFLALRNANAGPGLALTNTVLINAPKNSACSWQVWLRSLANTGSISLAVKDGFAAGKTLATRTINASTMRGARRDNGYVPYRLNFRHGGNLIFVSLDGFGPVFVALDDVSITCRTR